MEAICGKRSIAIDRGTLLRRIGACREVAIDLGTGDGRCVRQIARDMPGQFAIGIDTCRENLRENSRRTPGNALYLIADALALPDELAGLATRITINFPWGSLLRGLLQGEAGLLAGLRDIARSPSGATLAIRVNDSALAAAGWTSADGGARLGEVLGAAGFAPGLPTSLDSTALRACPTTWAKRLAHGCAGQAVEIRGCVREVAVVR